MKSLSLLILAVLLTFAQNAQCVQIWTAWSDYTRHEVNLESGAVVSYDVPPFTGRTPTPNFSPDGLYTADVDTNRQLRLRDNRVGISIVLGDNAFAPHWSPDGTRLAYLQPISNAGGLTLNLLHLDDGQTTSLELLEEEQYPYAKIAWSPDGTLIAAAVMTQFIPETYDILLLSAQELTPLMTVSTTQYSPTLLWSPSGRALLVYSTSEEAYLLIPKSEESFRIPMQGSGSGTFQFFWSPDETYLLFSSVQNDWLDYFNVITIRGELLLEHIIVNAGYEKPLVDWVNDHQLIASTDNNGFSDLSFFDLHTGEQQILQPSFLSYQLSSDRRYAAFTVEDGMNTIQFYDLSLTPPTITKTLTTDSDFANFLWYPDQLKLLVLFEDRTLRSYDFAADSWHDVATIPGEEFGMRFVSCTF